MHEELTQDNLYLLLPSKVCWMAEMLMSDYPMGVVDAIRTIYASDVYKRLEREETKAWHLGPVALYEELVEECGEKLKDLPRG